MALVPKYVEVDAQVIDYWQRKLHWNYTEFACLVCDINPYAYENFKNHFLVPTEVEISDAKVEQIEDVIQVIRDRVETHRAISNTPSVWHKLSKDINLPQIAWLKNFNEDLAIIQNEDVNNEAIIQSSAHRNGVTTSDIAHAFDGIKWPYANWKKTLSDPPKWLRVAQISSGLRGRQTGGNLVQSLWDPISIASLLAHKNSFLITRITKAFKTAKPLADWQDDWAEYKETHFDEE